MDHTLDAFKIPFLHLGVVCSIYRAEKLGPLVLFGFLLISVFASTLFAANLLKAKLRSPSRNASQNLRDSVWRQVILASNDFGILCLLFLAAPFHLLDIVYAVWGTAFVLFCCAVFFVSYRELAS